MRRACRAARDALDGRLAALSACGYDMVLLRGMAPRLRGLVRLELDSHVRDFGALGDALAPLPSPALMTKLVLAGVDADALGEDPLCARRLAAALARLSELRSLELHWSLSGVAQDMPARAAAALAPLRRLPALAELKLAIESPLDYDDGAPPLYSRSPPRAADLLPWRQLESIALREHGAALARVLTQREVATQLSRLQALTLDLNAKADDCDWLHVSRALQPLAPLWRAPWIGQLTKLELLDLSTSEHCRHCRGFFEALPAPGGAPLMPRMRQLHISVHGPDFFERRLVSVGRKEVARLLGACALGGLRRLTLEGFDGVRHELTRHAAAMTALTSLRFWFSEEDWRAEAGGDDEGSGGGGDGGAAAAAARAEQLAAFLAHQTPPDDDDDDGQDFGIEFSEYPF